MAQSKVTDFFNTRRRNQDLQPSKRRKLNTVSDAGTDLAKAWGASRSRQLRSKDTRNADLKVPTPIENSPQLQPPTTAGDHTPEILAACDDHNGSPPSTPTKLPSTGERSLQAKRKRSAQVVRKDLLADLSKTPEGYDFAKFSQTNNSARKKLNLEPKEPVPMPESLSPKQKSHTLKDETAKAETSTTETSKAATSKATTSKPESTKVAPRNPEALRAKLSKSGKLAELQANLAAYSGSVKKIKASRSKANEEILEKEKEEREKEDNDQVAEKIQTNKSVPAPKKGTPKKTKGKGIVSVRKEAVKLTKEFLETVKTAKRVEAKTTPKAPADERFQHLVAPPSTLTLPGKFSLLGEMFSKADDVVRMLYNRAETCTFAKLKSAVQRMVHKNFEESHLGQMKTVMPDCYTVRQEKGLPSHGYHTQSRGEYHLTVEPILDPEAACRPPVFTPDHQIRRKNIFYWALVTIVKRFHQEFLASLSMSLDDDKITHWHPRFKVNDIPDIEPAELPKPPNAKKLTTAAEVLEQAKGNLNPRIRKALELMSGGAEEKSDAKADNSKAETNKPTTTSSTPATPRTSTSTSTATSGIDSSLLERVRAKERAKQALALTASPAHKERRDRLARLPELVHILRTLFIISRKPALPLNEVVHKLSQSSRTSLGFEETHKHVDLMLELLPDWLQTLKVKAGTFMKLDKNKDVKAVLAKIEAATKELS